jgi:hypothetical protein
MYHSFLEFNIVDLISSMYDNHLKFDIADLISLFKDNGCEHIAVDGIEGDGSDGDRPEGDGPDSNHSDPGGYGPEGDGPGGDDSDPDRDNPRDNEESSSKGKGKARAISPEPVTEEFKVSEDTPCNDESSGKGKGKARAISPEPVTEDNKEPYTELDNEKYEADLEKAKSNSLKQVPHGESSKEGANLSFLDQQKRDNKHYEYYATREARLQAVRSYNDIVDQIEKHGDNIDKQQKESLLNESIRARNLVDQYTTHVQNLKNELNIPSSEEEFSSEENSSGYSSSGDSSENENNNGDNSNGDSSDEESRPTKRPRN